MNERFATPTTEYFKRIIFPTLLNENGSLKLILSNDILSRSVFSKRATGIKPRLTLIPTP